MYIFINNHFLVEDLRRCSMDWWLDPQHPLRLSVSQMQVSEHFWSILDLSASQNAYIVHIFFILLLKMTVINGTIDLIIWIVQIKVIYGKKKVMLCGAGTWNSLCVVSEHLLKVIRDNQIIYVWKTTTGSFHGQFSVCKYLCATQVWSPSEMADIGLLSL